MITDCDRMDALESRGWRVEGDGPGRRVYVGPIYLEGKPWGVGMTLREAVDDAIQASGFETGAIREAKR